MESDYKNKKELNEKETSFRRVKQTNNTKQEKEPTGKM